MLLNTVSMGFCFLFSIIKLVSIPSDVKYYKILKCYNEHNSIKVRDNNSGKDYKNEKNKVSIFDNFDWLSKKEKIQSFFFRFSNLLAVPTSLFSIFASAVLIYNYFNQISPINDFFNLDDIPNLKKFLNYLLNFFISKKVDFSSLKIINASSDIIDRLDIDNKKNLIIIKPNDECTERIKDLVESFKVYFEYLKICFKIKNDYSIDGRCESVIMDELISNLDIGVLYALLIKTKEFFKVFANYLEKFSGMSYSCMRENKYECILSVFNYIDIFIFKNSGSRVSDKNIKEYLKNSFACYGNFLW